MTTASLSTDLLPVTISAGALNPEGSDVWFRQVIHGLIGAASDLQSMRDGFGQALGLTGNQYLVLLSSGHLQSEMGPTIADLAKTIGHAQPHITAEVGRLVRLDLLRKEAHPTDKRSVIIRLTPAGRTAIETVIPLVRRVNDALFEGVTAEEFSALQRLTQKIKQNALRAEFELKLAAASVEQSA